MRLLMQVKVQTLGRCVCVCGVRMFLSMSHLITTATEHVNMMLKLKCTNVNTHDNVTHVLM